MIDKSILNSVLAANAADVETEEDETKWSDLLLSLNFDDNDELESKEYAKLCSIYKADLKAKTVQLIAAFDELQRSAGDEGATQQKASMQAEIDSLQEKILKYKRQAAPGDNYMRSEMNQLEEKNVRLTRELGEAQRHIREEERINDQRSSQLREVEGTNLALKRELEQAQTNIKDYQRQLESQRESMILKRGEDVNTKGTLQRKNREMSEYLTEIKRLQDENDQLLLKIDGSKDELIQATHEMNKLADDYHSLKIVLEDTESMMDNMREERDVLRSQIQDLRQMLQNKQAEDNSILASLEKKASEWKSLFNEKEDEIENRDKIINELQLKVRLMESDSEKSDLVKMKKDLQNNEQENKILKEKLEEATKEIQEVTNQIDNLKNTTADGLPSLRQQFQLKQITEQLAKEKESFSREQERVIEAEKELMTKDKTIHELSLRMNQYEKGQYGLHDAVQEIKDLKSRLNLRDSNIEGFAKSINRLELENDALLVENEEFRERLGLEPREKMTIDEMQQQKHVRQEQMLTLNRVLSKEIESLEEERLQLKQILRKQAMERGARAVELGLTSSDLKVVEDIANEKYRPSIHASGRQISGPLDIQGRREVEQLRIELEDIHTSNSKLQDQNKDLKDEVCQLEIGLKELLEVFRSLNGNEILPGAADTSNLDRLISILDARKGNQDNELNSLLKSQINTLQGRNLQLHDELDNLQKECRQFHVENSKKDEEMMKMSKEMESLREIGDGVIRLNPLKLPEGMLPSSSDIIASLDEYLVQVLQELHNKESLVSELQTECENAHHKISVISHQQALIYKDHIDATSNFETQMKTMKMNLDEAQLSREQDSIRTKQYEESLKHIEKTGSNTEKQLVDYARKVTVLKVNERALRRRYTILQESDAALRRENKKLSNDTLQMDTSVAERIGYLERHKEMNIFKISALQKKLDECVPLQDLEKANREYNDLTSKYRNLLQNEANLTHQSVALENLQAELAQAQTINEQLKKELQLEKERSYSLQQMHQPNSNYPGDPSSGISGVEVDSLSRKLATLEMMVINETQKSNHATHKYDQLKILVNQLENRNNELETRFQEMAKTSIDSQKVEMTLREQLQHAVPIEISNSDKEHIKLLERKQMELANECEKLKEVADVATHQAEGINRRQISQERELTSLRHQLYDLQMETDEKTIIAKLHQQIISLNISESVAIQKLESANSKSAKYQSSAMKWQQKCDEKDHMIYRLRMEQGLKTRFLKKTIQDMRRQYAGSLPLVKQEKYAQTMQVLKEKNVFLEKKLDSVSKQSREIETSLAMLAVQKQNLEELIETLSDRKGAEKVVEWHKKVSDIRCDNALLKRQLTYQQEKITHYENVLQQNEFHLQQLEAESEKVAKELDERQLLWEQHEVELERNMYELEKQQKDLLSAAQKFEEATGSIPDPSLPVAKQLQLATDTIKNHVLTIVKTRAEAKKLNQQMQTAEDKVKELNHTVLSKEKVIADLRLHLPATKYHELKLTGGNNPSPEKDVGSTLHATAVKAAETTIESLKMMLSKKEETICKYEKMLSDIRQESSKQAEVHKKEIKLLQDRVKLEVAGQMRKIKQLHLDFVNEPKHLTLADKQLAKLNELQEVVEEQDTSLADLADKLASAKQETKDIRKEAELALKEKKKQMESEKDHHKSLISSCENQLREKQGQVDMAHDEITALNDALEAAKIANESAPSKTMKTLVERLRNQLSIKDKQQKSLSQALLQLRADMVDVAKENVEASALKSEEVTNVQLLIDKKTSALKSRVSSLESKLISCQQELQSERERTKNEIDFMRKEINEKENAVFRVNEKLKDYEQVKPALNRLRAENKKLKENQREMTSLASESITNAQPSRPSSAVPKQDRPTEKVQEEVFKWEESKKWQKKVEVLREKLKDKSFQHQKLEKSNEMMKDIINRLEKDKLSLQARIKGVRSTGNGDGALSSRIDQTREDTDLLKRKIFELENENNDLQRKAKFGVNNDAFVDLKIENEQLQENLKLLISKQFEESVDAVTDIENSFRKDQVSLKRENLELQFEVEQTQIEIPRLKARVQDVEEYVEVLKSEIERYKSRDKHKNNGPGMGGQSVEDMERVIAAMRRVIERIQVENESLKKNVGKRSTSQSALNKENRELKQELQRIRTSMADNSESQVDTKAEPMSKQLAQENQKLRKDLRKAVDDKSKELKTRDTLLKENNDLKKEVDDLKGNKSVSVGHTSDDQVKRLKAENDILRQRLNRIADSEATSSLANLPDKINEKLQEYDRLVTNEVHLRTVLKTTEVDLNRALKENKHLKKELEAFDPSFFEEIEDLKYNYKKSVELNIIYERQLVQFSKQFGIDVKLQNG